MHCPKCEGTEVADLIQNKNTDKDFKIKKCHECSCVYMEFNFTQSEESMLTR